jgi:4-carboxymuconolactone decarboxylase
VARLPEIRSREELPEEERGIFDYIEKTRGGVHLPYSLFLHHPELAYRKLHVGSYVRFESSLPRNVAELAICTAAREFDCRFEWAAHAGAASRVGVSPEAVDVIAHKRDLDGLSDEEALPIRFARQLLREHRVTDETYAAALERYGKRGVMELAAAVGYYVMSACWMNLLEIEPPADRPQLPDLVH